MTETIPTNPILSLDITSDQQTRLIALLTPQATPEEPLTQQLLGAIVAAKPRVLINPPPVITKARKKAPTVAKAPRNVAVSKPASAQSALE